MNKKIVAIVVVVLVVLLSVFFLYKNKFQYVQTNEPAPLPVRVEDLQTKVGETAYGNTDISITPLKIIEDSRCPANVNCIWAGRIIVKAKIAEGEVGKEYSFTEGEKLSTDFGEITMTEVTPVPLAGQQIKPEDYRFTFRIER